MFIPIDIVAWDELGTMVFLYEGKMLRDFGPWKKDQKVELTFDFEKGQVIECNENGTIKQKVNIKLEVTE